MKSTAIYVLLGLLHSRAGAFVPRNTISSPKCTTLSAMSEFVPTVDISALSLVSPGMKEFVLFVTPLSALAGGAVVQQRRKEFANNMEFTQLAMNETKAILSRSSNNFKIYTGLAIASFAVGAASQFGLLPSSLTASSDLQAGSLSGMDTALFTVPVAAFAGGAFFKLRSDEVFQNLDATKRAMNQTQTMMIESQSRGKIFTGISALSFGIALLSQLGSLEFVSFSADNPATYKRKDTPTTVAPYKSLDSLQPPPEIKVPSTESSASKDEISSSVMNENKPSATPDAKIDE